MLLNLEVRVEVEDNLLVGFRGVDNPLAVLVGGIVLGVARGGDVASIFGIQATSTGWVWKRKQDQENIRYVPAFPLSCLPSLQWPVTTILQTFYGSPGG
jgi:hypothetical protein